MKIREIDLQNIALLKLSGKLDRTAMLQISRRTQYLFNNHHFKVILDLKNAQVNDVSLIFLADFLHEFKKINGKVKVIPGENGGFRKIEMQLLPSDFSFSTIKQVYH